MDPLFNFYSTKTPQNFFFSVLHVMNFSVCNSFSACLMLGKQNSLKSSFLIYQHQFQKTFIMHTLCNTQCVGRWPRRIILLPRFLHKIFARWNTQILHLPPKVNNPDSEQVKQMQAFCELNVLQILVMKMMVMMIALVMALRRGKILWIVIILYLGKSCCCSSRLTEDFEEATKAFWAW